MFFSNGEKRSPPSPQSQAWQVAEAQKHRQGEQPEEVPGPQHEADGLLQVAVPDAQGISACIIMYPGYSLDEPRSKFQN